VMPGGEMTFANGYAASLTMGVGQFCTNPGIAVGVNSAEWSAAKVKVRADIEASPMGKMLTDLIEAAYLARAASLTTNSIGDLYGIPQGPQVYEVTAKEFLNNAELHEEVFGPFGVIVTAESYEEMVQVAEVIQGQLTATIFAVNNTHRTLIDILTTKVGRLIFDGFPTGVEVCEAMQHGGPYPATSDSRFTSVGNHAIARWLRPICLQNPPSWLD
jgi:alpha-ketoglutaric semialdehyde dehydrogenase